MGFGQHASDDVVHLLELLQLAKFIESLIADLHAGLSCGFVNLESQFGVQLFRSLAQKDFLLEVSKETI